MKAVIYQAKVSGLSRRRTSFTRPREAKRGERTWAWELSAACDSVLCDSAVILVEWWLPKCVLFQSHLAPRTDGSLADPMLAANDW